MDSINTSSTGGLGDESNNTAEQPPVRQINSSKKLQKGNSGQLQSKNSDDESVVGLTGNLNDSEAK